MQFDYMVVFFVSWVVRPSCFDVTDFTSNIVYNR